MPCLALYLRFFARHCTWCHAKCSAMLYAVPELFQVPCSPLCLVPWQVPCSACTWSHAPAATLGISHSVMPTAMLGLISGVTPGAMFDTALGVMPGVMLGPIPGIMPAAILVAIIGVLPGAMLGCRPEVIPGAMLGAVQTACMLSTLLCHASAHLSGAAWRGFLKMTGMLWSLPCHALARVLHGEGFGNRWRACFGGPLAPCLGTPFGCCMARVLALSACSYAWYHKSQRLLPVASTCSTNCHRLAAYVWCMRP